MNAAAQQAPANPIRQRSKGRLWGGVGMMGAGVVIAFYSQSCEATGALASDFVLNDGLLTTTLAPSGLGPLVKDGRCGIDFNIRGTIRGNFTGTVYEDISGKYSDLADDPDLVAGLNVLRGTADGKAFYPKGRMYAGLGIAAAGALLATMWSDVPVVRNIAVAPLPGGARVTSSFGF